MTHIAPAAPLPLCRSAVATCAYCGSEGSQHCWALVPVEEAGPLNKDWRDLEKDGTEKWEREQQFPIFPGEGKGMCAHIRTH